MSSKTQTIHSFKESIFNLRQAETLAEAKECAEAIERSFGDLRRLHANSKQESELLREQLAMMERTIAEKQSEIDSQQAYVRNANCLFKNHLETDIDEFLKKEMAILRHANADEHHAASRAVSEMTSNVTNEGQAIQAMLKANRFVRESSARFNGKCCEVVQRVIDELNTRQQALACILWSVIGYEPKELDLDRSMDGYLCIGRDAVHSGKISVRFEKNSATL